LLLRLMRIGWPSWGASSTRVCPLSSLYSLPSYLTDSSLPPTVREQHFSDRQRLAAKQQFQSESEAEMKLKEDFARAEEEKEELAKAKKSAAATPRIAGVGTPVARTPRTGLGGRTGRRFGV
jgi:hypothetical protein